MSVLRGWMYSGFVFQLATGRGFALHPSDRELDELHRDPDVREDLATMTVAVALPRFREHALIRGGWRFEGGASLTTYFMGCCLYVFPNEFRRRRVQMKRWQLQDRDAPAVTAPRDDHVTDPAVLAVGNQRVRDDLGRADGRTRAIVALTIDGYSQAAIAEMLGECSTRAIEGVLHRWRIKEQNRLDEGGD
jgi:DNA-directed RNA polymerase specialized sigma24 family protein